MRGAFLGYVNSPPGLRFLAGGIGKGFKTPALLSIYVSKKRAPWPLAYLSISQKNGRLTFFLSFFVVFYEGKMVCSARFHPGWVMGGVYWRVIRKNSRK